jgi:DNA end-binding protein Ku
MPPSAIWRGAISFGMVAIPVRLYTATENQDISFRQLVAEDLQPMKQLRWSPTLDREVEYGELVRGYEYAKDQYVVLSDEDFDSLPVPSKQVISISQFVHAEEIDPVYYEKSYYLDPDEAAVKPYALLHRAMVEKNLIAIGQLALRQKEHLVAIRPQDGHLTAELLLYPDEVRPYEGTDISGFEVSKPELDMAFRLIDMLQAPFDPGRYTDDYREALLAIITAKLEGGEVVAGEAPPAPTQTVDLMAALRASVEAARSRSGTAAEDKPTGEPDGDEKPAPKAARGGKKSDDSGSASSRKTATKPRAAAAGAKKASGSRSKSST